MREDRIWSREDLLAHIAGLHALGLRVCVWMRKKHQPNGARIRLLSHGPLGVITEAHRCRDRGWVIRAEFDAGEALEFLRDYQIGECAA